MDVLPSDEEEEDKFEDDVVSVLVGEGVSHKASRAVMGLEMRLMSPSSRMSARIS